MEMPNNPIPYSTSSSSVRVLVRPPPSSSTSSNPTSSSASNGLVVVGFIGPRAAITTHLMNRIIDSNVFGSGNLDKPLCVAMEGLRDGDWFNLRKLSYHLDDQKGILFLHFSSDMGDGFELEEQELEFGNLQGMLFMFSVCHVMLHIQDGSRFDTQLLKKFRVLQAAKNSLVPFVRSQIPPVSSSGPTTSASTNPSPAKNRSMLNRSGSSISLMSGLGSHTSLFPGQCNPVILFVFVDDFSGTHTPTPNVEESSDTPISQDQSSSTGLAKPNLPAKVSSPVIVLAHPVNKSEVSFRKKLQSSMEAQIRFLIKKCRTLSSSETSHGRSRSDEALSGSVPLFSLDSSRAVVLLERSGNQRGESLDYATRLVEDVLNGKETLDFLLLESHGQIANKEDITSVKDFINRQSDILRGKGAPVTGVGMVAVAAAAAAASAASGKTIRPPELPNMELWLSSSQAILHGILSAKGGSLGDIEISKRKLRSRNSIPPLTHLNLAVSWLESCKGLNTKFSTLWCEKTLPVAKEVYLKDLPSCYPTSMHEAHLKNALNAFYSMVKGPSVEIFAKRLEDECTAVWKSNRQLCDEVSLTGKPCMHQIHNLQTGVNPHCSGYYFLHACACGRSRKLRLDPFDFESANTVSSCFVECDKLLHAFQTLSLTDSRPVGPSSWSLIRVGGEKYYEPSKGLLQSGFSVTQKFLLKWEIYLQSRKGQNNFVDDPGMKPSAEPKFEQKVSINETKLLENEMLDVRKISFGKGLPKFAMWKPFAEVVAGSAYADSEFPPLQQNKHPSSLDKSNIKQSKVRDPSLEQKSEYTLSSLVNANTSTNGDPYLIIGSNIISGSPNSCETIKKNPSFRLMSVYIGFEYECPHGHRFILNPDHLNGLGSLYQQPEESRVSSSVDVSDKRHENPSKLGIGNRRGGKVHQISSTINVGSSKKERSGDRSNDKEPNRILFGVSNHQVNDFVKDLEGSPLDRVGIDDNGQAFSMLNRNLPLYMNCPHCTNSKSSKELPKFKFAGTVSQLQRIFMVTPPYPLVLATCPLVQFEASCLPSSISSTHEQNLQFSMGSEVVLPPQSFITLRLPFVYGVETQNGVPQSFKCFENRPEATAWIVKGTTLRIVSRINSTAG